MADASNNANSFDAGKQHLGKVYTKAILAAAGKNAPRVLEELESLVNDVLKKLPQLQAVLSSPRVDVDAKEAMLDKAFGKSMSPVLLRSLKVIARHNRLDCLFA